MDPLTLNEIAAYAGGTLRRGEGSRRISDIVTDSRTVQPGELFLALSGDKHDGHAFLDVAESAGAAGAIIADGRATPGRNGGFAVIAVADTLQAYQRIARVYRSRLPMRVVGITGSNGKTSTKDFTAAVLEQRFRVLKTEGNLNNHIGVPRMLLRASQTDEVAVLEMGMNHPGEIKPLAEMARPDVAIITNIGTAHIEYMGSREAIALEKGVLAEAVGTQGHVILPAEDPFTPSLAARTAATVLTVGLQEGDIRADAVNTTLDGSTFEVVYHGRRLEAFVGVPGEHMIVNALLAVGAGLALGVPLDEAVRGLAMATLTKGRLQRRQLKRFQIIDDSYNANPDSVVAALKTVAGLPSNGRRFAVLGKMGELGVHAADGYRRVGREAGALNFDCLIAVGDDAAPIAESAADSGVSAVHRAANTDEAACLLSETAEHNDLILVKGSRSAGMERIISALAQLENEAQSAGSPAR